MKPCRKNKKRLAWLAANALDGREAEQLRAHLSNCPGCHEYWRDVAGICGEHSEAAEELPDVRASGSFHERLVSTIREKQRKRAGALAGLLYKLLGAPERFLFNTPLKRNVPISWRIAIPAGAFALTLLAGLLGLMHRGPVPPSGSAPPVVATDITSRPESSYSTYRMAANTSLEALDELLTRQAARRTWSPEGLSVRNAGRMGIGTE